MKPAAMVLESISHSLLALVSPLHFTSHAPQLPERQLYSISIQFASANSRSETCSSRSTVIPDFANVTLCTAPFSSNVLPPALEPCAERPEPKLSVCRLAKL